MSAFGPKRTRASALHMTAFGGKADMIFCSANVCFVRWFQPVSFPKIISGRIGDAVQPRSEWRQWRQIVGLLDARAHLSVMPSACALDCNMPHRWKEFGAGASHRR